MRVVVILLVLCLAAPALAQGPGTSCQEQLAAAGVLIPRLEWSRRDLEHASAHELAKRDQMIQHLSGRAKELEAEVAKLKAAQVVPIPPARGSHE